MHEHRIVLSCIATAVFALALLVMVQTSQPAPYIGPVAAYASAPSPVAAPPILTERAVSPAWPKTYKVRPGDSLSSIARSEYGTTKKWPSIFWQNNSTIKWANIIMAGTTLTIPDPSAASRPAPAQLGPPAPRVIHLASAVRGSDGSVAPVSYRASSGGWPGGSFGNCVVTRESGGNSQVMNSSGHYGLYQFSESTWEAYGGSSADFGHASAGEQEQIFMNAMARQGESNWSLYDGC